MPFQGGIRISIQTRLEWSDEPSRYRLEKTFMMGLLLFPCLFYELINLPKFRFGYVILLNKTIH